MGGLNDYDIEGDLLEWCEDCEVFHSYTLWRKPNGHLYLTDSDGDATPIYRKDADAMIADKPAAWKEYYQDVAQTGNDYLNAIMVSRTERQNWTLFLGVHEERVHLIGGIKEGTEQFLPYKQLPDRVYEFGTGRYDHQDVGVERTPFLDGVTSLDEIKDSPWSKHVGHGVFFCQIDVKRDADQILADIKQRAAALAEEQ